MKKIDEKDIGGRLYQAEIKPLSDNTVGAKDDKYKGTMRILFSF